MIPDATEPVPRHDPVNDYTPNGRPGSRAPHVLLPDGRSALDLFGPGFTVLTAEAAPPVPASCNVYVFPNSPQFEFVYGLKAGGCVLVRPDGYEAARWRQAPPSGDIENALATVLGRSVC